MPIPKKKPQLTQRFSKNPKEGTYNGPVQPAPKAVAALLSPQVDPPSPEPPESFGVWEKVIAKATPAGAQTGRISSVQPNQASMSKPEPRGPYGFAADPLVLSRVQLKCEELAKWGITLRMVLGCVNHLLNEAERKP